ncbi:SusC/RagA family TonB-linked outer membrane protein [Polaribacter sp. ALD11]|uniref:SusC/RagA family TonB-linked outer membrane protein n=1 Tax=Polaribacter sp. ALD11 TaxID=2058137 RepID=UPI000C30C4E9|nr:SusC/RagA family TonB-linked outer membrane protein [Polaribacter sp. ALD11]AUC86392.1 SusC/RagA family TonB-linked outer membrane protein [Polaribacter sp. ALD11]
MRTFIYLFCTISFAFVSSEGVSQNAKIKIDSDITISVEEVFELIKKQTDYTFVYENSLFNKLPKVVLNKGIIVVKELLNKSLEKSNVVYIFNKDGSILLKKKIVQQKITGTLIDKNSMPIIGASVSVKGTGKGTATDFDGKYSIAASKGDVLVFQSLGFQTKEVAVGSSLVLNVSLEESTENLAEIVITTGYDKINKKSFTGAATTINAVDLKIDGINDVSRMLEGKVAGVNVQNITGTFGAAPQITIRGSSSVFGNNNPLYVIDGVVQEDIVEQDLDALTSGDASTLISSSIAGINATDIKKIDILKDASATSIYGARARNGVIVITTKSGKKSSPLKVTYTLEQTVRDIPSYSQYDILDSKETVGALQGLREQGFLKLPAVGNARFSGIYGILEKQINSFQNGGFGVVNTQEGRNKFLQQYELANTNWFKTLFRQSLMQNHSINFSGGGENNSFYASIGFVSDPGWSIADKVTRLTSNIKNTYYFSDKFKITLATVASIRDQKAPGTFRRVADVVDGQFSRDFDINPFSYALNTSRALRPRDNNGDLEYYTNNWAPFNILEELQNNTIDLDVKDIRFQFDASYKITDALTYDLNMSSRYVNSTREHQVREKSNVVRAYNSDGTPVIANANIFLYTDPNNPDAIPVTVFPEGGLYIKNDNTLTSYYVRNSFKYDKTFNNKHNINALLGQELRYVDRLRNEFTGYGLQFENGFTPFTDPRLLEKIITDGDNYFDLARDRERTVAFFGRATYSYDDKYIFSATGRYDGSNRQGESTSSRWLPTATVSGKWNASDENFIKDSNVINNLQFRSSYGLSASPGPATNALAIFRSEITDRLTVKERETFLNIDDLENSELTWEKQYELNLGFDLGLFNNRIQVTADVWKRDVFDNIDLVRTNGIGGQLFKFGNNADIDTKGVEFAITTKNIKTTDFSWSTSLNFSYFDQKITKLQNEPRVIDLVDLQGGNVVGFPLNSLFSFKFNGLNNQGVPTFELPEGDDSVTDVNFQDSENILDYLVSNGSVQANMNGGFSNTFKYKNWDLRVLITGAGGNVVRLNPALDNFYTGTNVFTKSTVNRWMFDGDETRTNIPKIVDVRNNNSFGSSALSRAYNAYNFSTDRVASGDFLRMKNVSLGYNFDGNVLDKIGLSSLRVQFQGTNLFLIYSDAKLNGQDPEFYGTGGVALPITRQFTMSLNIGI